MDWFGSQKFRFSIIFQIFYSNRIPIGSTFPLSWGSKENNFFCALMIPSKMSVFNSIFSNFSQITKEMNSKFRSTVLPESHCLFAFEANLYEGWFCSDEKKKRLMFLVTSTYLSSKPKINLELGNFDFDIFAVLLMNLFCVRAKTHNFKKRFFKSQKIMPFVNLLLLREYFLNFNAPNVWKFVLVPKKVPFFSL